MRNLNIFTEFKKICKKIVMGEKASIRQKHFLEKMIKIGQISIFRRL